MIIIDNNLSIHLAFSPYIIHKNSNCYSIIQFKFKAKFKKNQVTREDEVKAAFGILCENFGRVDVIVNCAGIPGKLYDSVKREMQSLKEIAETVNVLSYYFLLILSY